MERLMLPGSPLQCTMPEGFHEMTQEELIATGGQIGGIRRDRSLLLVNPEKHLIFDFTWEKIPLLVRFLGTKTMLKNAKRQIAKRVQAFSDCGGGELPVAGETARGLRYGYTAKGRAMLSDYYLLRRAGRYYGFVCIGRKDGYAENFPIFTEMLRAASFAE